MQGAREFAKLFKTGQYGKLYIVSGNHARGRTFQIQILPKDEVAIPNGENNLCLNKDAVEVYGVTGGNPGWSESYGWLHRGPWEKDFKKLTDEIIADRLSISKKAEEKALKAALEKHQQIQRLLDAY